MEPGAVNAGDFLTIDVDMRVPFAGHVIGPGARGCEPEIGGYQMHIPSGHRVRDDLQGERRGRVPCWQHQSFAMRMCVGGMIHHRRFSLRCGPRGEDKPDAPSEDKPDQKECESTCHGRY